MDLATQVQIIPAGDMITVNVGAGKWSDKVGAGAAGMWSIKQRAGGTPSRQTCGLSVPGNAGRRGGGSTSRTISIRNRICQSRRSISPLHRRSDGDGRVRGDRKNSELQYRGKAKSGLSIKSCAGAWGKG